jgi:hypothetical protein
MAADPTDNHFRLTHDARRMLRIAVAAARADWDALSSAAREAREARDDRAKVEEALLQTTLFCGFPRVVSAFEHALAAWPTAAPVRSAGAVPQAEQAARGRALFAAIYGKNDEAVRQKASDYAALMTPVVKAYLTDRGLKVCSDALQVHGGSGFTEHFPASQYMRDVRIALIYEGTNGVQALDLVGRKLPANGGRAMLTWLAELEAFSSGARGEPATDPFLDGLDGARAQLQEAVGWLMQNGLAHPDNAAAGSNDFLHLVGLTALSWMWARMALVAQAKIAAGDTDARLSV